MPTNLGANLARPAQLLSDGSELTPFMPTKLGMGEIKFSGKPNDMEKACRGTLPQSLQRTVGAEQAYDFAIEKLV